jgi:hypothetical protein
MALSLSLACSSKNPSSLLDSLDGLKLISQMAPSLVVSGSVQSFTLMVSSVSIFGVSAADISPWQDLDEQGSTCGSGRKQFRVVFLTPSREDTSTVTAALSQ